MVQDQEGHPGTAMITSSPGGRRWPGKAAQALKMESNGGS
jgi:hypothetical protein